MKSVGVKQSVYNSSKTRLFMLFGLDNIHLLTNFQLTPAHSRLTLFNRFMWLPHVVVRPFLDLNCLYSVLHMLCPII